MSPCFSLARCQTDLCHFGRAAVVPVNLSSFCESHWKQLVQFIVEVYFSHSVKVGLFLSTPTTVFLIFKTPSTGHLSLVAWKAKKGQRALHLRRVLAASKINLTDIVELLQGLPSFELTCLLDTPLAEVDVIPNVRIPLNKLDVSQLCFDAQCPGFVLEPDVCISCHVLAAPYVMLINGSTTPDPRLYKSGTLSLWTTATGRSISTLRCGLLMLQLKTEDPFKSLDGTPGTKLDGQQQQQAGGDYKEQPRPYAESFYDQFSCEL